MKATVYFYNADKAMAKWGIGNSDTKFAFVAVGKEKAGKFGPQVRGRVIASECETSPVGTESDYVLSCFDEKQIDL